MKRVSAATSLLHSGGRYGDEGDLHHHKLLLNVFVNFLLPDAFHLQA
jgi:hypothetical protein